MENGSYVTVSSVFHLEKKDREVVRFLLVKNVVVTQTLQQIKKAYLEETLPAGEVWCGIGSSISLMLLLKAVWGKLIANR
jgi:hypothetical protein